MLDVSLSVFPLLPQNCLCLRVAGFLCDCIEYLECWDLYSSGSLPKLDDVQYSTCFYELNYTFIFLYNTLADHLTGNLH